MWLLYGLSCDYYMIFHVTISNLFLKLHLGMSKHVHRLKISNLFEEFHLGMPKHVHWFKIS